MGIYVKLNHYFFLREGVKKVREIIRLINSLVKSEMFESIHSLSIKYLRGFERKIEDLSDIKDLQKILDVIENKYNIREFYKCELRSTMSLFKDNNLDVIKIPISIKVWRKVSQKGHIAIEFITNKHQFNSFFIGKRIWAKKNKKNIIYTIEKLNIERLGPYHTSLIAKINIGQNSFPFENVKEAFYIWRNTPESAYRDIMKFRQQLIRKYKGINIEDLSRQQQKKIKKIKGEMIKPYDLYYFPKKDLDLLTINIVLRLTHLIDEYIKPNVIVERGSYKLQTPEGSPELLFPILYDINLKINKVYKMKIPTKIIMDKDMREGFYEVFTTSSEFIKEMEEKGIRIMDVLNQHIRRKMKEILDLKPDWNGERAKSYKKETFNRAKNFLISLMQDFWILYNIELDIPMIFPGIDGDIDIEWKNERFQLLISIPVKSENLAGLYGSDYAEDEIELDFDISKTNIRLLSWLRRQM